MMLRPNPLNPDNYHSAIRTHHRLGAFSVPQLWLLWIETKVQIYDRPMAPEMSYGRTAEIRLYSLLIPQTLI